MSVLHTAVLGHAKSFRDLIVYQKARNVADRVFDLSRSFPREEMYSLTDQARRSSRAIGAQIAEAWGKRRYERYFLCKLTDADSEQLEAQHWIDIALRCRYLRKADAASVQEELRQIGVMLHSMMSKARSFCSQANKPVP